MIACGCNVLYLQKESRGNVDFSAPFAIGVDAIMLYAN